ncbi:MAG: hypothetical protein E2O52_00205 [Gammaproteobacteria bacterium]|nr:MAG: hypothetical protein E2O52_00205 [Gammaproteobacteria bacterium]
MINSSPPERLAIAFVAMIALLAFGTVNAATVTLNFDTSFGDPLDTETQAPEGPTPWFTAEFVDSAPGEVELVMTVSGAVGVADVTDIYFNLDPVMDATDLTFTRTGGTGPTAADTAISTGTDAFQADSDGLYDILFDLPPPPGSNSKRFNAGETLEYTIIGAASAAALTASSFNFLSTPQDPPNDNGPFLAAAKFGSTGTAGNCLGGEGACSDWIAATPIPIPAAAWLFGSALGLLVWTRRRRSA